MTRDSAFLIITFVSSLLVFVLSQFDVVARAFSINPIWHDRLQVISAVVGFISGYLRMSPLSLHQDSPMATTTANAARTLGPLGQTGA